MYELHVTERDCFKRCLQQYNFKYILHLQPLDTVGTNSWFGIGIHKALAEYYAKRDNPIITFQDWYNSETKHMLYPTEKVLEFYDLGCKMLDSYLEFSKTRDKFRVCFVEQPLTYQINDRYTLVGTLDLLVYNDVSDKFYAYDHKTYSRFIDLNTLGTNDQGTGYSLLVVSNGFNPFGGVVLNQLLKDTPCEPKVLKNGGLSKDKSIRTTKEIYLNKLVELNLDVTEYSEVLEKLEGIEFFRRDLISRTPVELELFKLQLENEVALLDHVKNNELWFPNFTRDCYNYCPYFDMCKCKVQGGDWESIADSCFKIEDVQHGTEMS